MGRPVFNIIFAFVTQVRHATPTRQACKQPHKRSYTSNDHGRGRIDHLPSGLPSMGGQNKVQQNTQPDRNTRASGALGDTHTHTHTLRGCATHRWFARVPRRAHQMKKIKANSEIITFHRPAAIRCLLRDIVRVVAGPVQVVTRPPGPLPHRPPGPLPSRGSSLSRRGSRFCGSVESGDPPTIDSMR